MTYNCKQILRRLVERRDTDVSTWLKTVGQEIIKINERATKKLLLTRIKKRRVPYINNHHTVLCQNCQTALTADCSDCLVNYLFSIVVFPSHLHCPLPPYVYHVYFVILDFEILNSL